MRKWHVERTLCSFNLVQCTFLWRNPKARRVHTYCTCTVFATVLVAWLLDWFVALVLGKVIPLALDNGSAGKQVNAVMSCFASQFRVSNFENRVPRAVNRSWSTKHGALSIYYRVASIEHRVSSIVYRASSIEYRASSIEYRASSIEYQVHQVSSIEYRVPSIKH